MRNLPLTFVHITENIFVDWPIGNLFSQQKINKKKMTAYILFEKLKKKTNFLLVQNRSFSQFVSWKRNHNKYSEFEIGEFVTYWWITKNLPTNFTNEKTFCTKKLRQVLSWMQQDDYTKQTANVEYQICMWGNRRKV